jgi:SAM-dependent methyltransferase
MSASPNEIRTEPRPDCFLCGLPGKPLYDGLPSALFETAGRWSFNQCLRPECGLIWINPRPIESDLHIAYETYFTHAEPGENSSSTLRDTLYAAYCAANYPLWALSGIAKEKVRRREMFLNESTPGKLLDVGCGDGTFLNLMRGKGWQVDGIDFDPKAIQTAQKKYGLTLRHGDLQAANLPAESFDTVTMSHVVEHLTHPVELLTEIRRLLKPGGQLVMTTPNTSSLGHQKFGSSWFGIDPPRHLHLFNQSNLSEVASRAGFHIAWAGSTSANADVFIGASYTLRENNRHRMGHQPTPSVLRTIKAAYWHQREHAMLGDHLDCGDELVLICKK